MLEALRILARVSVMEFSVVGANHIEGLPPANPGPKLEVGWVYFSLLAFSGPLLVLAICLPRKIFHIKV